MAPQKLQIPSSAAPYSISALHREGEGVAIVFCCGFRSDMESTKATAIDEWCAANNAPFTRFDYFAHGTTGGAFEEFTIGRAMSDAMDVIDANGAESLIIIGSSMGAWVALNAALERKDKIRGFIGIAAAPDFTENLMFARMTPEQRQELEEEGKIWVHSDYTHSSYPITQQFITEARQHLLLEDVIGLDIPVHLMHGQEDVDVPWETSLTLASRILADDVVLTLIKDGDHRLNRPADLSQLLTACGRMRAQLT